MAPMRRDGTDDVMQNIHVKMPIETYWEVEKVFKEVDYLASIKEDGLIVNDELRKALLLLYPYVAIEKEREWLMNRLGLIQKD